MASKALPLLLLGAGALVLMSKKKPTPTPSNGEKPSRVTKNGVKPAPVPGDQVKPGEVMLSGSTVIEIYGAIAWNIRRYAMGPQFYAEIWDPEDRAFDVATTGRMENDPVKLFDAVDMAAQWTIAFIKSIDVEEPKPPAPQPQPQPVPVPEPVPEPEPERGEAYGMGPGVYPNVYVNSRYGLVSPYRTPATTVSIRRKSGMIHYPAKPDEARFVGWNPQNPEEALIDIDSKGEYSIMTHDGGPKGVFIAEWVLKVTEG